MIAQAPLIIQMASNSFREYMHSKPLENTALLSDRHSFYSFNDGNIVALDIVKNHGEPKFGYFIGSPVSDSTDYRNTVTKITTLGVS